jgi:hypothetical protein
MRAKADGITMMRVSVGLVGMLVALMIGWTPVNAAQIVIANSVECIDIPLQQTTDGTPMSITAMSGVCLDVMGSAPNDGAQIIIVRCNDREPPGRSAGA